VRSLRRKRADRPAAGLARRRHRLAPYLLLFVALGITGGAYAAVAPSAPANAADGADAETLAQGRALFDRNCTSCHGLNAEGTTDGPSLVGVGAAAVDFQVATGRMPAARSEVQQVPDKPNQFTEKEIAALAAYIASLGAGPAIPTDEQISYDAEQAAEGGEIYRTNCSMCHNFAGSGGALTGGKYAPKLRGVEPRHIYEAMLTGPQAMPVFNDRTMPPESKQAIIAFLKSVEQDPDPGGHDLGKMGPVTEGLAGWVVATGLLVASAVWLGAKAR
jgi:ubiquinol-cytochrome c reductase cytochrome c subunit